MSVETLSKTFTSMTVLTVAAGTNTPQGGDAGHGGVTIFELTDEAGTDWQLTVEEHSGNKTLISNIKKVRLEFYGDSEADTFIAALKFALEVYKLQRMPSLLSKGVNP